MGEAMISVESGVPSHKMERDAISITTLLRRYRKFLRHFAHAIWLESRTLGPRMKILVSMMSGSLYLQFGKVWESRPNEPLQPNTSTNACILDTQLLMEKFPWVSAVEIQFFLMGWDKRGEFHVRNRDSCNPQ